MTDNSKSERLNLRISPTEQKRLQRLEKLSDAASATEVIRRALAVYEHLWNAKQGEVRILLRDRDGKETDLLLL
jgi:hypothetical protein